MANRFFAAIKARFFNTPADTAVDIGVNGDANPRVAIDAGGRISWGDGANSLDTNLYRAGANKLKTDDRFHAPAIEFDLNAGATPNIGEMVWNDNDGTVEVVLKGGNVTLQVGQETVHRVVNRTGSTIHNGQAVRLAGSQGQRVEVALAQANNEENSSKIFGVATEDIANNQSGYITTEGLVRGINTSHLTEGAIVWLSPSVAGGLTTAKPTAPDHLVMVGICVIQGNNGTLHVHVQNGYEVDELHDVKYTNLQTGDLLTRTANNLWENISRSNLASDPLFTDHGNSTGLADDDHTQYLHVSTSRSSITSNIVTTGNVGANKLIANTNTEMNSVVVLLANATPNQNLDTSPAKSIKYLIHAQTATDFEATEILAVKNSSVLNYIEYGKVSTNGDELAQYDVVLASGNMRLNVTPSTNNMTFTVFKTMIV